MANEPQKEATISVSSDDQDVVDKPRAKNARLVMVKTKDYSSDEDNDLKVTPARKLKNSSKDDEANSDSSSELEQTKVNPKHKEVMTDGS